MTSGKKPIAFSHTICYTSTAYYKSNLLFFVINHRSFESIGSSPFSRKSLSEVLSSVKRKPFVALTVIIVMFFCSGAASAQVVPDNIQRMMSSSQQSQSSSQQSQSGKGASVQQPLGADTALEMQAQDPEAAQAFSNALQSGDYETAKKIYADFKNTYKDVSGPDMTGMDPKLADEINQLIKKGDFYAARILIEKFQLAKKKKTGLITRDDLLDVEDPSVFERTLSGDFPSDILDKAIKQFGYDLFQNSSANFTPSTTTPVGPDYLVGPGDQITLTLWGTTEGIYNLVVTKEGQITLPKVGVVSVAGTRFGDLGSMLREHLSRYYTNFNLSVAMGKLKTITVYLVGEVTNPGSYSLSSLASVYGALVAAGGPTKKGTLRSIQVLRGGKVVRTVDLYDFLLKGERNHDIKLQQEDTIFVPLIGPVAGVSGSVYRPAIYELKGSESIGDVLQLAGGVMPIAVANRLQVYRFSDNEKKMLIDINISPQTVAGVRNGDTMHEKVQNMDLLSVQPIYDKVWETVNLQGDVRLPGDFQWRQDLKLKEVIQEGQLLPTADLKRAEIIRLTDDYQDRKIIPVNLAMLMNGDDGQNIALRPKDQIRVFTLYRGVEKVRVTGEVMSPGEYEIQKGEKLSDLLRRAGGFTPEAYAYGAVFKRKDVKNTQDKNMQPFIAKMQAQAYQIAASSSESANSAEAAAASKAQLAINQSMIENMKTMQQQSEGRVSINITSDINQWDGSKDDLLLKNGDSIFIPKKPQEVLVMGEVHSPSAQVYVDGYDVKNYINQTGGYTDSAAKDQVYVLQANGFAYSSESPSVGNIEKSKLKPGDTILVPQKAERNVGMRYFRDIIDILFKTAVVVATLAVLHL